MIKQELSIQLADGGILRLTKMERGQVLVSIFCEGKESGVIVHAGDMKKCIEAIEKTTPLEI